MGCFVKVVNRFKKWLNIAFKVDLECLSNEVLRQPSVDNVICSLPPSYGLGVLCLFEPNTFSNFVVGRKAVQGMPNNLAKRTGYQIASDRIVFIARNSPYTLKQILKKLIIWKAAGKVLAEAFDLFPRHFRR